MKTDAIRSCIKMCEVNGLSAGRGAEAELTALEAQIAVKDEALQAVANAECLWLPAHDVAMEHVDEAKALHLVSAKVRAALSPLTGKALVDREKLRSIEFIKVGNLSICPVCFQGPYGQGHADGCWLAAFLKED